MSQSIALQTETEIVMTEKEAGQLAIIEERIHIANFFKGPWLCEDFSEHSLIIIRKHHEPHENCAGDLILATITGKPPYRNAISRLIARAPSMLALLEKALPIIEAEAGMRDAIPGAPFSDREGYWIEMRGLTNEINAEIDKAYGREAPKIEPEEDSDDYDYAADDRNFDAARERSWKR